MLKSPYNEYDCEQRKTSPNNTSLTCLFSFCLYPIKFALVFKKLTMCPPSTEFVGEVYITVNDEPDINEW